MTTASGNGPAPATIPQNSFSAAWIEVFTALRCEQDRQGFPIACRKTSPKATARRSALTSQSSGDRDGNVGISVPADVLQQLAGKSSTIAITLQSTSDEPTQITVECDFQSLGDCAAPSLYRQRREIGCASAGAVRPFDGAECGGHVADQQRPGRQGERA
jgi:hypothetical protein